jgi:hypothetical protein
MHFLCFECIVFILFFAISVFFGVSFFDRQDISLFEVACFKMLLVALGIMERQLFFPFFLASTRFSVSEMRELSRSILPALESFGASGSVALGHDFYCFSNDVLKKDLQSVLKSSSPSILEFIPSASQGTNSSLSSATSSSSVPHSSSSLSYLAFASSSSPPPPPPPPPGPLPPPLPSSSSSSSSSFPYASISSSVSLSQSPASVSCLQMLVQFVQYLAKAGIKYMRTSALFTELESSLTPEQQHIEKAIKVANNSNCEGDLAVLGSSIGYHFTASYVAHSAHTLFKLNHSQDWIMSLSPRVRLFVSAFCWKGISKDAEQLKEEEKAVQSQLAEKKKEARKNYRNTMLRRATALSKHALHFPLNRADFIEQYYYCLKNGNDKSAKEYLRIVILLFREAGLAQCPKQTCAGHFFFFLPFSFCFPFPSLLYAFFLIRRNQRAIM